MLCLSVSVTNAGGHVEEADGSGQEDYDSMEKAALVAKLKQVGVACKGKSSASFCQPTGSVARCAVLHALHHH